MEDSNDRNKKIHLKVLLSIFQENYNKLLQQSYQNNSAMPEKRKLKSSIWLLISTIVLIAIIAFLVIMHWTAEPVVTINLDFNIGETIGGILIGAGALLAGHTYYKKEKMRSEEQAERRD